MTTFYRIDPETREAIECEGRTVACATEGCVNEGFGIEVADDPNGAVVCGPCGLWIIPPPEPQDVDEPADETDTTEPPELPGVSA